MRENPPCPHTFEGIDRKKIQTECIGYAECILLNEQLKKIGIDVSKREKCAGEIRIEVDTSGYISTIQKFENNLNHVDVKTLKDMEMEMHNEIRPFWIREFSEEDIDKGLFPITDVIKDEFDLEILDLLEIKTARDLVWRVDSHGFIFEDRHQKVKEKLKNSEYKDLLDFIKKMYAKIIATDLPENMKSLLEVDYQYLLVDYVRRKKEVESYE